MEIVLENPSVPATAQIGLPTRPPHHFPRRATFDVSLGGGRGCSSSLLPGEDYYARNRHALTSYGDLDGAPAAPVTVRRIDKSGLLEIAETDPVTCPRPCVLTGAEDARGVSSLRIDRSGLLEAVPEADQPEERDGEDATTLDEAAGVSRGETLKVDADMNPHVFEGGYLMERPSSLEGQACPDEVNASRSADFKALSESSPRAQLDVFNATERLPHLPYSPGPSSLRRLRSDVSRRSPLTSRCADSVRGARSQIASPEFTAKCTAAAASRKKPSDPSQSSPITREQSQMGCTARSNVDPASIGSDVPIADATIKMPRESHARGAPMEEQEKDNPPGEERAEAEGCEHTTVESLEEDEVSFKGSNKLLDNDNVQTLRVIILSEQL